MSSNRAPFSISSISFNHTQGLNLKENKAELLRHKNEFLLRKSFDLVLNDAIARAWPKTGAKVVLCRRPDGELKVKFNKDGRGFTAQCMVITPLHGREQPFESNMEKVTISFEMPASEETETPDAE